MCLQEVISALRDRGIPAEPYRVHHAIACGRVPRPPQSSGRFVYGPKDVELLADWLAVAKPGRQPKQAATAATSSTPEGTERRAVPGRSPKRRIASGDAL